MKKFILLIGILIICNTQALAASIAWNNNVRTLFAENRAIIYAINIRTFAAIDLNKNEIIEPDKGDIPGTFVSAVTRLEQIKSSGINTLNLLPITPVGKLKARGTAGSVYAISDFSSINPQLDDKTNKLSAKEEARKFVQACHSMGLSVIVDLPAFGSYDLYLKKPDLFLTINGQPVIPGDLTDVRIFKTLNNGKINQALYNEHVKFIDMLTSLGVDGIRAEYANTKTAEFWSNLINYTRKKDAQFIFIASNSPKQDNNFIKEGIYTDYDKLVEAGFDSYFGDYNNYLNYSSTKDLFTSVNGVKKLSEKYGGTRSVIGNFATVHDISPALENTELPVQLFWLSALLPINSYFVDGIDTGSVYIYSYANQKALKTFTDDPYFFVEKGKTDIYNFSRMPNGANIKNYYDFFLANKFKGAQIDLVRNGILTILHTNNANVFAYQYDYKGNKIIVIVNPNISNKEESVNISVKWINDSKDLIPIRFPDGNNIEVQKGKIKVTVLPSNIIILATK